MIELKHSQLSLRFPDVHLHAVCQLNFQRTLRIPDDNRAYPLPPGLGRFPLEHVEDHSSRLPSAWVARGGVLLPMYQAEALWIRFSSGFDMQTGTSYPFAIKIAAGKINVVTGDTWSNALVKDPQDYVVVPGQPWLGIRSSTASVCKRDRSGGLLPCRSGRATRRRSKSQAWQNTAASRSLRSR